MLVEYIVVCAALFGGGSAIGMLILTRSDDGSGERQERWNDR